MRGRILAGLIVVSGLLGPAPAPAVADCEGTACGAPACWSAGLHARPGRDRELLIGCRNATGAKLLKAPEHATISAISTDWDGVRFTVRPAGDAPRSVQATFEVQGPETSVEVPVEILVKPLDENSPPVCQGDRKSQRSDGSGPVDLFLHPYCYDPDYDEFVMHGGGPGTHPMAPKQVPSGSGEANWYYRTATHAGAETAAVWAVDSLGARSEDAYLQVEVGPGIDRLPDCLQGWGDATYPGVQSINTRPGAVRAFRVLCKDLDQDVFAAAVTTPPSRGALAMLPGFANSSPYWGFEQWYDMTYVPAGDSLEPDPFALTATGARGAGPQAPFAMTPRPLPENGGGHCGYSALVVAPGGAGALEVTCGDDEGDPLMAEVVGGPLHGTAGVPVVVPGPGGDAKVTVPYVPAAGYEGYDCVKVRIFDGHGFDMELTLDVYVRPVVEYPPPPELPVSVPLPPAAGPRGPAAPPLTPGQIDQLVKTVAKDVLHTNQIQRLPSPASTYVYTAGSLSRRELLRAGKAPAVFVICPTACRIGAGSRLVTGARARGPRRRAAAVATPGKGQLLWMQVDGAQRRTLRRVAKARAAFEVSVRPPGARARRAKRAIPIAR